MRNNNNIGLVNGVQYNIRLYGFLIISRYIILVYREDIKLQDSPYPIQIPARRFHPKIGKTLGLFVEQTQGRNECSMKSQSIFPILGCKVQTSYGNFNWIGGVLKLYVLTV